ncbi:MAG: hypothetical protein B5M54_08675 [Candidatus Aminicenantes bacterium 4484_214]|nr:MAG: hypothetical protein B5M54_08675 [Candidatus Aminicenantes bacterium 4484_214]
MSSLGQDLKKEREVRGISLQEIAEATKISLRYLQALEEDQFELLPGKFLTRAIIRSYAQQIGLDPEKILQRYQQYTGETQLARESTIAQKNEIIVQKFKSKKIIGPVLVIFLILFLVLIITWSLLRSPQPTSQETLILTPLPSSRENITQAYFQLALSLPASFPLKLHLKFNQKTWLQVYADGILKINGLLYPGEEVYLEAKHEFLLHVGNAGGFQFTLNSLPGRRLGQSGQVLKNIRINHQSFRQYLYLPPQITPLSNTSG